MKARDLTGRRTRLVRLRNCGGLVRLRYAANEPAAFVTFGGKIMRYAIQQRKRWFRSPLWQVVFIGWRDNVIVMSEHEARIAAVGALQRLTKKRG